MEDGWMEREEKREDDAVTAALSVVDQMRQTGNELDLWRSEVVGKIAIANQRLGRLERNVITSVDRLSTMTANLLQTNAELQAQVASLSQSVGETQALVMTMLSGTQGGDA
jgi:hypothetical protein